MHESKANDLTEAEMMERVKKAEKGKKMPYEEFVKTTKTWKDKVKKAEKGKKIKWEDAKRIIEKW